jgi:curli biogenesis system outer membrane secretion channel CsgG
MYTKITALSLSLLLGMSGVAQQASRPVPKQARDSSAAGTTPGMTAADVLKMLRNKIGEPLIAGAIQRNGKAIELSVDQMVELKSAGASDDLLVLIQNPRAVPEAKSAAAPVMASQDVSTGHGTSVSAAPASGLSNPPPALAQGKKRVAIDEFDYSTVRSYVAKVFGADENIGKGIRAMLATRITQGNHLIVVERGKLDTLKAEVDRGSSSYFKKGTVAAPGGFNGAEVYLMGDIIIFGRDDSGKKLGLGALIPGPLKPRIDTWGKEDKAVVAISYRLVDAATTDVISVGEARGESSRKSKGFGGLLAVAGASVGGSISMESSNFAATIIGEATMDCVNKLAAILNESAPKLEARKISVVARVAEVVGSTITINAGSNQGLQVGHQLAVESNLGEIKDPVSQEVLDTKTQPIGVIVITRVTDRIAIGTFTGTGLPKNNDVARTM